MEQPLGFVAQGEIGKTCSEIFVWFETEFPC